MKYCILLILLLGNFVISTSSTNKQNLLIKEDHYILDLHMSIPVIKASRIYKNDIEILARLIEAESGNQKLEGRVAVGNVVLNRARINNQTIKKIIYKRDKRGRPQFDGIDSKYFKRIPSEISYKAARLAFSTKIVPDSVYYFHNPKSSTDGKWIRYIETFFYKDIQDHRFCYYNK